MMHPFTNDKLAVKKDYAIEQGQRKRYSMRLIGVIVVLLVLLLMAGLFFYRYKHPLSSTPRTGYYAQLTAWMTERKHHLQQMTQAKKALPPVESLNEDDGDMFESDADENIMPIAQHPLQEETHADGQQIHFEFYNTLPNMQVMKQDKEEQKWVVQPEKQPLSQRPIIEAKELEEEFSNQLQQKRYVIQLGLYHNIAAAEQYRKTLVHAGLKASIIKVKGGNHPVYRVQQGPFHNRKLAKLAQKNLQKQGISSILRQG